MSDVDDRLMQWLRDAHAAEEQAESMLSSMAKRIEHYPQRIEQHIDETRSQAQRVRQCIERRGGSTSGAKDVGGKMLGFGQAISGLFAGDEVVKGSIASYAFEAMEIASYQVLAETAREAGDNETAQVCEEILQEEKNMADWLEQNIPEVTHRFLSREEAGATAKH